VIGNGLTGEKNKPSCFRFPLGIGHGFREFNPIQLKTTILNPINPLAIALNGGLPLLTSPGTLLLLIQVFQSSHLTSLADRQHKHIIEIEPVRGSIYDRNLRPVAFNIAVHSLFANPEVMTDADKQQAVAHLSPLLGLDASKLQERLNKKKYFVWIKRKLDKEAVNAVKAEKINGLNFRKESKRYYPNGSLAAHIIGFAGTDNKGLEGIELLYNNDLKGKKGHVQILRDARQRELRLGGTLFPPQNGFNLVLTIDETIQYIAEKALEKSFKKYKAKSASIIVVDIATGEVLALANRPTYNLASASTSRLEERTNRAVSYVYEPGSIFKIVTAAAALEEEKFIESDKIFCENGKYRVGNHTLHDHRPHGKLTFQEVFEMSSNIGVTKIAQALGAGMIYKYSQRFRFGMPTGINLKGEVNGLLKHPSRWSKTSIGAIPIGHEVTATPLQLVCAMASIANNGIYMKPYVVKYIKDHKNQIIKSFEPQVIDRVISRDTARRVTNILTGVVDRGTATRAQIKGVKVAGKTGTAQKVIDGKYSHDKFYASFMGFAPADAPRLAAIVVFDDPSPSYFGGTVAAPVFKEVIENALKYLESQ